MFQKNSMTNREIVERLGELGSVAEVAKELGCSKQTIWAAKSGRRRGPVVEIEKRKRCQCCHSAPIMPGNRFLCVACYKGYRDGGEGFFVVGDFNGGVVALRR